jgi:hypothetical protein
MTAVATTDVTVATIDEMEPIHGGLARRARATLGVSSWGMQVLTLPPDWEGYRAVVSRGATAPSAGGASASGSDRRGTAAPPALARTPPGNQTQRTRAPATTPPGAPLPSAPYGLFPRTNHTGLSTRARRTVRPPSQSRGDHESAGNRSRYEPLKLGLLPGRTILGGKEK